MLTSDKTQATDLLRQNHQAVQELFQQFEKTGSTSEKETIMSMIAVTLFKYTVMEEQVFYPAIEKSVKDGDFLKNSLAELTEIKLKLEHLKRLCADQDKEEYERTVKELKDAIEKHSAGEEKHLFPTVEASGLDMGKLAERMTEAQIQLGSAKTDEESK